MRERRRRNGVSGWVVVLALCGAGPLWAQAAAPPVIERVTFDQAIERALANNPTVAQAAAGILRAEALLQQARAANRPTLGASIATTVIDPVTSFEGSSIVPRAQVTTSFGFAVPILTPVRWAERNQAADQVFVAEQTAVDLRRGVAVATGEAYLQVIALRRVVDLNERALETARAHFDYAGQRYEGGVGSRLDQLRAQQEVSTDETRVEEARLAVWRAQEALGVLLGADGPVDAADEPVFEAPPEGTPTEEIGARPDVRLAAARYSAAQRVVNDSWREYLPSVTGLFDPRYLAPSGLFANARNWSAQLVLDVPLWDSGERSGRARERRAQLSLVGAERAQVERQALSEIRAAREAVRSTERAVASARAAADQAAEVVRITDVAFRAGATTNIEVIDAQRSARDAETAAAIAEDAARRARLELQVAIGTFP